MSKLLKKILFILGALFFLISFIFLFMTFISDDKNSMTILVSLFGILNGGIAIAVAEILSEVKKRKDL